MLGIDSGEGGAFTGPLTVLDGDATRDGLRLLASGAIDLGRVSVICLEPIRDRLGARWERKQDVIWEHVHAFLKRFFGPADLVLKLDPLNVLIAQPESAIPAARVRCVQAAAELMKFFLGEATSATVDVRLVASVSSTGVTCARMPIDALDPLLLAAGADMAGAVRSSAAPMRTPQGRRLSVTVDLQRLWQLKSSARVIGYYAHTVVTDEAHGRPLDPRDRETLHPSELCAADVSVLQEALHLRAASPGLFGGLVIPVSYFSIANSTTRNQLLQAVKRLPLTDQRSFLWEITDLSSGIPAGKLAEVVTMVRGHCRGVICQLPLTIDNAEKAASAGATLSTAPPLEGYTELQLLQLESKTPAILKKVPAFMLHGVAQNLASVAAFVGVTHCTFAKPGPGNLH